MQKIIKLTICLFITANLFACDFLPEKAAAKADAAVFDVLSGFIPLNDENNREYSERYDVYVRDEEYHLAMYEPYYSCYLGAYIEEDKSLEGDIGQFEQMAETEHCIYAYKYTLGETFPVNSILTAVSYGKVPLVEIHPDNTYSKINYQLIDATAKAFGMFSVPMFISYNASSAGYGKKMSKEFYIALRSAFAMYAPKCAFVWCVSSESDIEPLDYYPGDEWVNWVGIDAFADISVKGSYNDIFPKIDAFYYAFQKIKPIMLTNLGVSSFSSVDYSYKISEAILEIQNIYDKIENRYPRIKSVIYAEHSKSVGKAFQSYLLTDSEHLLNAYALSIGEGRFVSVLDTKSKGDESGQWMLSSYAAYRAGERYFISETSFVLELGISDINSVKYADYSVYIDRKKYFDINLLRDYKLLKAVIDENDGKIFISG